VVRAGKESADGGAPGFAFVSVAGPVVAGEARVTVVELPGGHGEGVDSWLLRRVGCQGKKICDVSSVGRENGEGY